MGNAAVFLNGPTVLGALFSGPSVSPHPQLRKLVFYAAFHNSNRYSTPFDPFSVWSKQGDITPWDNKSTRGQEVRLTPCDLWPYEISLSHMSVAHHAPALPMTRGKLGSQEQQHKPAPSRSKDPSELLNFTSWVQPAIETPPRAGHVNVLLMCCYGCCRFEQRSGHTLGGRAV